MADRRACRAAPCMWRRIRSRLRHDNRRGRHRAAVASGNVACGSGEVEITLCRGGGIAYMGGEETGGPEMPQLVIVSWRDIPAQVIVKQGRKAAKRPLPERFEQAIDRCAMKVGARDDDAYLAEWRKSAPEPRDGEPEEIAEAEAARLRALIDNDGWAGSPAA